MTILERCSVFGLVVCRSAAHFYQCCVLELPEKKKGLVQATAFFFKDFISCGFGKTISEGINWRWFFLNSTLVKIGLFFDFGWFGCFSLLFYYSTRGRESKRPRARVLILLILLILLGKNRVKKSAVYAGFESCLLFTPPHLAVYSPPLFCKWLYVRCLHAFRVVFSVI